jgi:hypothetical protein
MGAAPARAGGHGCLVIQVTRVSSPEASYSFRRSLHYLPHEELVELFTRAGLSDLRPLEVPAEHYQVFT